MLPLAFALLAAGAAVAVSQLSATSSRPDPSALRYVADVRHQLAGVPTHGGVLGYADAPVTIHEYADLRCPACREWDAGVAPDVVRTLVRTHRARLALHVWPILGPNSTYAARAAYAAARQDRLWTYAQIAYVNQGDEQLEWFDREFARAAAVAAGLDLGRFDRDLADAAGADAAIARVDREARARRFAGTPTLVVQGPGGRVDFGTDRVPDLAELRAAVLQAAS